MVIFLNLKPNFIYIKLLIGKGKYSLDCKKIIGQKFCKKNVPGLKNQLADTFNNYKWLLNFTVLKQVLS